MELAPAISILMPVHNCMRYLGAAVDSIRNQSLSAWELIVVDDGSTDGSAEMLDAYARQDSRIMVIHQENRGLPKALNRALREAKAPWIGRMDGDDVAESARFSHQLEFLRARPSVGMVGSGVRLIDPKGRPLGRGCPPIEHEDIDRELIKGNGSAIYHPTILMRREVLDAVGGYDGTSGLEDLDLFLRLAEVTQLANLPEPLLHYRLHLGSTNANRRERHARMTDEVVRRAHVRRGLDPATAPRRRVLENSAGAVFEDWSMKASLSGHYRTALIHAGNAFANESGTQRWVRLARSMRFFGSRIMRIELLRGERGERQG